MKIILRNLIILNACLVFRYKIMFKAKIILPTDQNLYFFYLSIEFTFKCVKKIPITNQTCTHTYRIITFGSTSQQQLLVPCHTENYSTGRHNYKILGEITCTIKLGKFKTLWKPTKWIKLNTIYKGNFWLWVATSLYEHHS